VGDHLDHPVSVQVKHRDQRHRLRTQQMEVDSLLRQKVDIHNGLVEQRAVGLQSTWRMEVAWEGIAALVACLDMAVVGIVGVHPRRLVLVAEEEKQLVEEGLRDAPCLVVAGTVAAHLVHLQVGNMLIEEEEREQIKMTPLPFVSVPREATLIGSDLRTCRHLESLTSCTFFACSNFSLSGPRSPLLLPRGGGDRSNR
jgi:hypothetical protein